MKNTFRVIFFASFISVNCFAQSSNWEWAKTANGTGDANKMSIDANGNIYLIGDFNGSITFDTFTLTSIGNNDIFVVKYDWMGNMLWARSAGGNNFDEATGMDIDANGNVYVVGNFQSSLITFGSITLTNVGSNDIFFTKYDSNGNVIWSKGFGGNSDDQVQSVSTDVNGNVCFTGFFTSPTITFGGITLMQSGSSSIFLVKYDLNGNLIWANSAGGNMDDWSYGLTDDTNGNIYLTGEFRSSSIDFGNTTLFNTGGFDVFIAKYDLNGNVLWAKSAQGIDDDDGNSVATDANGNVYLTGWFDSFSINFSGTILTNDTTNGSEDVFLVKYDPNGNILWAKSAGGNREEYGNGITTDANQNVIITGSYNSSSIAFDNIVLSSIGSSALFIVKYDQNGNIIWAKTSDGGAGVSNDVISDPANNDVYVIGNFSYPFLIFGNDTLALTLWQNIFIAKLHDEGTEIKEQTNKSITLEAKIYPNPFNQSTNIEISNLQSAISNFQFTLYDVLGQEVHHQTLNSKLETLNLTLPTGIYFYKIFSETKEIFANGKLVIE